MKDAQEAAGLLQVPNKLYLHPKVAPLQRKTNEKFVLNDKTISDAKEGVVDCCNDSEAVEKQRNGDSDSQTRVLSPRYYPDGGWGWFCVLGSFIATFILGGVEKSFGLIFGEIEGKFHSSALATSWVGSLSTTCRLSFGFLGGLLSAKYSCRVVTFAGGLLYSIGIMLSSIPPNMSYLYIFYGLLPGLGGSMVYVSSMLIVNEYFDKRRGIANGIASAGSGLGAFCMPLLIQWLLANYGYFGEMLIVGATVLNICVSAALFRPLKRVPVTEKKNSSSPAGLYSHNKGTLSASTEQQLTSFSWHSLNRLFSQWWMEFTNHIKVMKNTRFSLFCISILLLYMSYLPLVYFLPALAEAANIPKSSAAFLLSIIGASDMCGRIASGFLFDIEKVKPYRAVIYNSAYAWLSLAGILQTLSSQYYQFCICSAVHGFFQGICIAQRSVIVTDVVGDEAVNHAVGILITCQGFGVAMGPSIAGSLVDTLGSYKYPFYFCASTQFVAGVLFTANLLVHKFSVTKKPIETVSAMEKEIAVARPLPAHIVSRPHDIFASFNFEDDMYASYLSRNDLATLPVDNLSQSRSTVPDR